jgi:hypothetical protein
MGFFVMPVTSSQALMISASIGSIQSLKLVRTGPLVPWYSPTNGIVPRCRAVSLRRRRWTVRACGESIYLRDTLIDGLESLVLAHVLYHFRMGPGRILRQSSPVVVVLVGATDIPAACQSIPLGHYNMVMYIIWLMPLDPPSILPLTM